MKKIITSGILCMLMFMFQGCLKDTCTRTYTMYKPIYKTAAEVRANIKSNAPRAVEKPGKLVVLGNYIFLNELDKGVHIIDNTNPSAPVNKHFIDIPGNVDIAVKGNILYADLYTDLVTLDISNPAAVQVTKVIDDVFEHRRYMNFLPDTGLIIVDWIKKDTTITNDCNISFGPRSDVMFAFASAQAGGSAASPAVGVGGSMARFTIKNNYLYTVTDLALNVFEISNATNPIYRRKVQVGWGIETIYPFGEHLFIGSTTGMFVFGTANPEAPNLVSSFSHARACDPVIADGQYAYVTLRTGNFCAGFTNQLDVINIQNISAPSLLKTYQLVNPHGLAKSGNILFVCDGAGGLKVYNAADPLNLVLMQTITGIDTYDAIALHDIVLVVAQDGLYQYNYSDPAKLVLLSKIARN
ncbi:LVIVD repeat-containing protein [Aridibaculum aurantiacum]|uniref:LVIVD repeat-containing protein n=1 Tax=Aridibaculum aurantiacum TaxID=2810307 RepID=UPI001A959F25|nr:hypothetical protein [Aridibaculum aurantiacum]